MPIIPQLYPIDLLMVIQHMRISLAPMMSHHIPVIWHAQLYCSLNSHSLMYIQYILNDTYIRLHSLIISKLYSDKLIGGDRISQ